MLSADQLSFHEVHVLEREVREEIPERKVIEHSEGEGRRDLKHGTVRSNGSFGHRVEAALAVILDLELTSRVLVDEVRVGSMNILMRNLGNRIGLSQEAHKQKERESVIFDHFMFLNIDI